MITIFIGCAGENAPVQEVDIDKNSEVTLDVDPEATVDIGGTNEASTVKQNNDEDNIESIKVVIMTKIILNPSIIMKK